MTKFLAGSAFADIATALANAASAGTMASNAASLAASTSTALGDLTGVVVNKVDKVAGKGLSTNDYTTAEQTKLGALPTAAALATSLTGKADASHTHPNVTTTTAGFMSPADKVKLDGLSAPVPISFSNPARALNTAFQISATRNALVCYGVPIVNTAALVGGSSGRVTLRYADDSGMTTNVVTLRAAESGTPTGVVLTLRDNILFVNIIPAGKWAQLMAENVVGTPSFGIVQTQETLLP